MTYGQRNDEATTGVIVCCSYMMQLKQFLQKYNVIRTYWTNRIFTPYMYITNRVPCSHLLPKYPRTHRHVNPLTPSEHVPPFRHGALTQSSTSETRRDHVNSDNQNCVTPTVATTSCEGTALGKNRSHKPVSQSSPTNPARHRHLKLLTSSIHVPPLMHDTSTQSSMSVEPTKQS